MNQDEQAVLNAIATGTVENLDLPPGRVAYCKTQLRAAGLVHVDGASLTRRGREEVEAYIEKRIMPTKPPESDSGPPQSIGDDRIDEV